MVQIKISLYSLDNTSLLQIGQRSIYTQPILHSTLLPCKSDLMSRIQVPGHKRGLVDDVATRIVTCENVNTAGKVGHTSSVIPRSRTSDRPV